MSQKQTAALTGAASGAATGAIVGGVPGAVIGGIIGAGLGYYQADQQMDAAKEAEKQRRRKVRFSQRRTLAAMQQTQSLTTRARQNRSQPGSGPSTTPMDAMNGGTIGENINTTPSSAGTF